MGRMSVAGSIAPLVPSELASVTRTAVVKFKDDLYRYLFQCQEIYNGDGAFHQAKTWSMIKMKVLQSMHRCGAFDSLDGMNQPQTVDEVTDSHIEMFLDKRRNADRRVLPQKVKAAVAASHIRADPADLEGAAFSCLGAIYRNLDKQGALSVLEDASGVKRIIRQVIENLSPPVFKNTVADSFDLWAKEERTVRKKVVSKIATMARDTCIGWPTSAGLRRTREHSGIATGPSGTKSSVDAGAALGLSKRSRRERHEDKMGGTAPKAKESKGGQQVSSAQGTKIDVDPLFLFANEKDTF
jgi:hypothetical protein